jgi:hypothetical protein
MENTANKSPTTIGLQWLNGTTTGGTPILDYTISWDAGTSALGF